MFLGVNIVHYARVQKKNELKNKSSVKTLQCVLLISATKQNETKKNCAMLYTFGKTYF